MSTVRRTSGAQKSGSRPPPLSSRIVSSYSIPCRATRLGWPQRRHCRACMHPLIVTASAQVIFVGDSLSQQHFLSHGLLLRHTTHDTSHDLAGPGRPACWGPTPARSVVHARNSVSYFTLELCAACARDSSMAPGDSSVDSSGQGTRACLVVDPDCAGEASIAS